MNPDGRPGFTTCVIREPRQGLGSHNSRCESLLILPGEGVERQAICQLQLRLQLSLLLL